MELNPLTPEEEKVIINKGTEKPFSGEYEDFYEQGMYVCKRCGAPLYKSEDKFDAHCGWPSFDDEIPEAVKKTPDADGTRTEITCARCGAHLGHVFTGEQITPKNVRHCVNSISLKFISEPGRHKRKIETAYFGGGCFWCTEAVFSKLKGVVSVMPGYAGGVKENPTYEEVSSGTTGHAEVIKVEYDPMIITYNDLLSVFFYTHDPTTLNRQGGDAGEQYRSVILYAGDEQKKEAENFINELEKSKAYESKIVTQLKPFEKFYQAENYHQKYFEKNQRAPYCMAVISPKLKKLQEKYRLFLKRDGE